MTPIYYDHNGRPVPQRLQCPECGYEHGYVWGYAPPREMRPNGGCPSCKTTWVLATGERISEPLAEKPD